MTNVTKALELASLIVDKPYRNEGLGKALVQAVEERAKSQHYTTIVVGCCPAYFEEIGYEPADKHNIFFKRNQSIRFACEILMGSTG